MRCRYDVLSIPKTWSEVMALGGFLVLYLSCRAHMESLGGVFLYGGGSIPGRRPLRSKSRSFLKGSSFRLLIRSASHIPIMGAASANVIHRHMPKNTIPEAVSFRGSFAFGEILSSSLGTCRKSSNRVGPSVGVAVGSATFGAMVASEGKMLMCSSSEALL
jgi:hypothetical protein